MEVNSLTTRWQHFSKNSELLKPRAEQERVLIMDWSNAKMVQLFEKNSDIGIFLEYSPQRLIDSILNISSLILISIVRVISLRRYLNLTGK